MIRGWNLNSSNEMENVSVKNECCVNTTKVKLIFCFLSLFIYWGFCYFVAWLLQIGNWQSCNRQLKNESK